MARFTSTARLDMKWAGYRFNGNAGTVFSIADEQKSSFDADPGPTIAGLAWTNSLPPGYVNIGGGIAEATLTGVMNDWATGATTLLKMDGTGTVTGFVPGANAGYTAMLLYNNSAGSQTLAHDDPRSVSANRISCPGWVNYTLRPSASVWLWYDGDAGHWRVVAP